MSHDSLQWRGLLLVGCVAASAGFAADNVRLAELQIRDETQMDSAKLSALSHEFSVWARRANDYLQVQKAIPVEVIVSRSARVGFYIDGSMYLPLDDHDEMLETFIHEFAHHATGHDSSYFFKEGIASHTLEALFRQQDKTPQGWPQYGVSNDAWVNLFLHNGQLLPLQEALDWPHYDGHSADADYRSWQVYLIGGSFAGWYIASYGYPAFKKLFDRGELPGSIAQAEKPWLSSIRRQKLPLFDPATQLPAGARYQHFAQRLPLH